MNKRLTEDEFYEKFGNEIGKHPISVFEIVQKHDLSHTLRTSNPKALFDSMSPEECKEVFDFIQRADNHVCKYCKILVTLG